MAVFTKGLYNCACARTVCDWSCTTYATMMSDLVPNTVVGYVPPLKKTNADRIRAMTDEELSFFLSCIIHEWFAGTAEICGKWNVVVDNWLDWLRKEAEHDDA